MRWSQSIMPFFIVNTILAASSFGFMRMRFEDQQIVERSPLIVVGHLKPDSVQYIPYEPDPNGGGRAWHHHAILVVEEIIKGAGQPYAKELPIDIRYGLTPVIDGIWQHGGSMIGAPGGREPNHSKGIIEIMDSGNSAFSFKPLVPDARDNNLWFLRQLPDNFDKKAAPAEFAIRDPEDLQPLDLKAYFLCYLTADPESAVRDQLQRQPSISDRATRYLAHCEIEPHHETPRSAGNGWNGWIPYWIDYRANWGCTKMKWARESAMPV